MLVALIPGHFIELALDMDAERVAAMVQIALLHACYEGFVFRRGFVSVRTRPPAPAELCSRACFYLSPEVAAVGAGSSTAAESFDRRGVYVSQS